MRRPSPQRPGAAPLLATAVPLVALLFAVLPALLFPAPTALAQEGGLLPLPVPGAGAPAAEEPQGPPTYPPRAEVGPRYLQLVDESVEARRRLAALADLGSLEDEVAALVERGDELAVRVDAALASGEPRAPELRLLRAGVAEHRDDVAAAVERLSARIAELDTLRQAWEARAAMWSGWRVALAEAEAGDAGVAGDAFDQARTLIQEIVDGATEALAALEGAQAPLRRIQERDLDLLERLDAALASERSALLERDAPFLLSAEHRRQVVEDLAGPLLATGVGSDLVQNLAERNAGLLLLALVLTLGVAFLVRHFQRRFPHADDRWRILLSHPWATGIFVAGAVTAPYYTASLAWRLAVLAAVAASACVLTRGMFRNPRKRWVVYVLAVAFVVLRALEAFAFPTSLFRLVVAAAAVAGAPLAVLLARRVERSAGRRSGFAWMLYVTAAVLALVLVAEILGYRTLAGWVLENGLSTAFVAFVTVFLARLARGAVHAALRRPEGEEGRLVTLRRIGSRLAGGVSRAVELVLVGAAVLYLLSVWDLFASPGEAWRRLISGGIDLGPVHLNFAQVALGLLTLYLSLVVSGVVKALMDEELGRRPELEPGVANSVATLARYALVVVGIMLALAVLGVDLSTFAIVAGALGVGIGFGLQDIVNNFFSGLILLFERPVRVGDVVIIDGNWAVIQKIGLRSTVVTTYDFSDIIVPNSNLIAEKVTNWTLSSRVTRVLIPVGVAYGSDLETVFAILQEVVTADARVTTDPAPSVFFVGFGESSLDFEIRVWIHDISERLVTRSDLLRKIDRRFREAGVTIPFPQRDVHLYPRPAEPPGSDEPTR